MMTSSFRQICSKETYSLDFPSVRDHHYGISGQFLLMICYIASKIENRQHANITENTRTALFYKYYGLFCWFAKDSLLPWGLKKFIYFLVDNCDVINFFSVPLKNLELSQNHS